jgi:hypothetical protein
VGRHPIRSISADPIPGPDIPEDEAVEDDARLLFNATLTKGWDPADTGGDGVLVDFFDVLSEVRHVDVDQAGDSVDEAIAASLNPNEGDRDGEAKREGDPVAML